MLPFSIKASEPNFQCAFLYPQPCEEREVLRPTSTCPDGQFEGFYLVEKTVRSKLDELLARELASNSPPGSCESLVAGGLCMALAYIQRCERELNKHTGGPDAVKIIIAILSTNLCTIFLS